MSEQSKNFWAGARAEIPLIIGGFPFGMIYGALAMNAGLPASAAQLMSSIVFAGSAQFITAQLVREFAAQTVRRRDNVHGESALLRGAAAAGGPSEGGRLDSPRCG